MNGDVHGGHASCGSVTGASRFLIGLVTCFATRTLQKNAGVGPGTGDERVVSATGETLGELWRNLAETFPELMWRLSTEAGEPSRWEAETHFEPLGESAAWASAPVVYRTPASLRPAPGVAAPTRATTFPKTSMPLAMASWAAGISSKLTTRPRQGSIAPEQTRSL